MSERVSGDWEDAERVEFFVRKQTSPLGRRIDLEFLDFLAVKDTWSCLDVGCGPGLMTIEAARRAGQATGADLSAAMVARAEEEARREGIPNVDFRRTPAEILPFEDGSFDLAFAASVIFLLPEPQLGLDEMARVVRPNGWVATYQPSPEMSVAANQAYVARHGLAGFEAELMTGWGGAAERYSRFSRAETEELYQNAGLVDVEVQPALDGLVFFARGRRPLPDEMTPPVEAAAAVIAEPAPSATERRPALAGEDVEPDPV